MRKDEDADPLEQYVWSPRHVYAPIVRWRDGNTDGDLDGGSGEGDSTLYYCNDANFNVTALVNASGTVVERYLYEPYGKVTIYDGSWANPSSTSAYSNEVLFTGHRLDPESGLYITLYRPYHPTLGDWTGRDPKGYVDGMGLYEYVRSRPIVFTDPQGLKIEFRNKKGYKQVTEAYEKEFNGVLDSIAKTDPALKKMVDYIKNDKDHTLSVSNSQRYKTETATDPTSGKPVEARKLVSEGLSVEPKDKSADGLRKGVSVDMQWDATADKDKLVQRIGEMAHDLDHVAQFFKGNVPPDSTTVSKTREFKDSAITTSKPVSVIEVSAVRTENIVRQKMGADLRKEYEGVAIPHPEPEHSFWKGGPSPKDEFGGGSGPVPLPPGSRTPNQ